MESLKKVSQQTVWQLLGKAITSVSTLIILGVVTRHFGESGTGIFTLALTYLAFFYLAADFGWNAYVMPELLSGNEILEWRKLLGLRIVWSIILMFLALASLPLLPFSSPAFREAVLFGCLAILGNGLFTTANAFFQSKLMYRYSIIASSIDAVPTVLLISLLVYLNWSVPTLLIVHALGWGTTGLISIFLVKKFLKKVTPIFDWNYSLGVIRNAWPISLTLMLNVVYFRIDSFILTSFKGFAEVGIYNVAYQVFQSALVLPTFIMNGYYPVMLEKLDNAKELFVSELRKVLLIMFVLAIAGAVLTFILSPLVLNIISGGNGFSINKSVLALRILSVSFPAYFLSSVCMWTLVTLKKYKVMLAIYLVGLIVNGILNFIFIPQYSFIASSWITGVSEYLILILQIFILVPVLRNF